MVKGPLLRWGLALWEIPWALGRTIRKVGKALRAGGVEAQKGQLGEAFRWWIFALLILFVQAPLGSLIYLVARTASGLQALVGYGEREQDFDPKERAQLKVVFGNHLALERVQLITSRLGVLSWMPCPFVLGETIYIPNIKSWGDEHRWLSLLVHEGVHVRQFQQEGLAYIAASLLGQWLGYPYNFAVAVDRGTPWERWNPEQQAMLVEMAWRWGWFEKEDRVLRGQLANPHHNLGFKLSRGEEKESSQFHDLSPWLNRDYGGRGGVSGVEFSSLESSDFNGDTGEQSRGVDDQNEGHSRRDPPAGNLPPADKNS